MALVTSDFRRSLIKSIAAMGGSPGVADTDASLVAQANPLFAANGAPALSESDYRRTSLAIAQALYTGSGTLVGYPEGTQPEIGDDEVRLMAKICGILNGGVVVLNERITDLGDTRVTVSGDIRIYT